MDDIEVDGSTPKDTEKGWSRQDELRMWKNVIVIGFGFMFLFTAFQNMAALQSSLNESDGIGVYTLALIYATIILSCFFLPTIIIKRFKAKYAMVICQFMYTMYIAAQFYPKWGTLIPASIFLGLAAAPMWSAKCTYLSQMGTYAGKMRGTGSEALVSKFFGLFFMMFQTWGIWGNIVTATVLKPKNAWTPPTDSELLQCASGYAVPKTSVANVSGSTDGDSDKISKNQIYLLAGIYLAFALIGPTLIGIFLDPLSRYGEEERKETEGKSGIKLMFATFSHFAKNRYQMLICPLTVWSGLEQGWFGAGFTAAFITCPIGVHNIGYILIVYASTDAACSFLFGWIMKRIGRIPVFFLAAVLNVAVMVVCCVWYPQNSTKGYLYLMVVMWGMADAVWQTQINAFYGVLFVGHEEPAFANYRLWESLGFLAAYLIGNNVVMSTFLYLLGGWLGLSFVCYMVIEVQEKKRTGHFSLYPCTGHKVSSAPSGS